MRAEVTEPSFIKAETQGNQSSVKEGPQTFRADRHRLDVRVDFIAGEASNDELSKPMHTPTGRKILMGLGERVPHSGGVGAVGPNETQVAGVNRSGYEGRNRDAVRGPGRRTGFRIGDGSCVGGGGGLSASG
ncbi:uncharacterized protein PGTG_12829 [Puccinia graminis f. sp. tritici CRL 75-36-700-3]|uniref:Uncharacterized protein n=1 Tax=Puccinia graminis f. sp. tritici (strain CRL 75-36-700-3 / race SCCL) TaxID=418459 RepID=E3KSF9_PUCGT|nr:uncharacterized protein PGTG_12829 [Puccinia graminis f. sp. tritici CRL 75-36-700-3]EFP87245.1 hypothetical protein PGTG_12829 [Puccinia graminis f. sp. tritici CRL 75-36-700-3]